jgi:hypothetical protein
MTMMQDPVMTEQEIQGAAAHEAAYDDPGDLPAEPAVEVAPARPGGVPDKFWDAQAGAVRTEALLKSYLELERKLGAMVPLPAGEDDDEAMQRLRRALGMPPSPAEYEIDCRHEMLATDPTINAKLHEAGFNQRQAQLVYDLAADHLLPLLDRTIGEITSSREAERLATHFGGAAPWRATAQQIRTWGQANLAPDVYETLAASYDGVLALHQMMQAREPAVLNEAGAARSDADESDLARMMRDPRYWRDRDPAFVARVTEGFRRIYPSQS